MWMILIGSLFAADTDSDDTDGQSEVQQQQRDTAEEAEETQVQMQRLLAQVRDRFPEAAAKVAHESAERSCGVALSCPTCAGSEIKLEACFAVCQQHGIKLDRDAYVIDHLRKVYPDPMAKLTDRQWSEILAATRARIEKRESFLVPRPRPLP